MRVGEVTSRPMREVAARPRLSSRRAAYAGGDLEPEVTGVTRLFARLFCCS